MTSVGFHRIVIYSAKLCSARDKTLTRQQPPLLHDVTVPRRHRQSFSISSAERWTRFRLKIRRSAAVFFPHSTCDRIEIASSRSPQPVVSPSEVVLADRGPVSIVSSSSSSSVMSLLFVKSDSYSNAEVNQLKYMRPTTIWFTQRKISQLFGNGWKSLVDTFGDVASGKIRVEELPPISVFFHNERYWVYSGNRRLRVLQELEKYHLVDVIPVYVVNPPVQNFESFWASHFVD
jgi:Zn-finger domain-containing protein